MPVCSTVCEPDRPPDVAEPTLADVERVYPRWHCWKGIAGLVSASRRSSCPPVVVRGEDPRDLIDMIKRKIAEY